MRVPGGRRLQASQVFGSRAKWVLGILVVLVAVLPSVWLAVLEARTSARLVDEVERGLRVDAVLFAERLQQAADQILYEENVRPVIERTGYLVRDSSAFGGAFYAADLESSVDSLIEYPFLIDFADSSIFAGRAAKKPGELLHTFDLASLAVERPPPGVVRRGSVDGPNGAFHYVYAFEAPVADRKVVMRGAKINPVAVLREVLPRAYRLFDKAITEQREESAFAEGLFGFAVETSDTVLVLSRIVGRARRGNAHAISTYTRAFDFGGLFPGWTLRVDYFNEAKANRWRRYLASLLPLLIVGVGVFITARLTMREMELSRVKSIFVSNVSHELKTPLTKIRFFNDLLQGLPPDAEEKQRRYHEVIDQECERLAILVDNVLDFNRIERGQMEYAFAEVPLGEVVAEVAETLNVIYEARGYHIELEMPEALPAMRLDPGAIKQALINLIDNAVKYSEPHTIVVRAGTARWEGQPAVALAVQDQGVGIPKDKVRHVFEEFYRVENNLKQRVSGSGLGLALVHHIVEAHGGTVRVKSQVGAGSTFTILLPQEPPKKGKSE